MHVHSASVAEMARTLESLCDGLHTHSAQVTLHSAQLFPSLSASVTRRRDTLESLCDDAGGVRDDGCSAPSPLAPLTGTTSFSTHPDPHPHPHPHPHPTRRYDVFCAVRDDEGSHWRTLSQLLQRGDADCMLSRALPS